MIEGRTDSPIEPQQTEPEPRLFTSLTEYLVDKTAQTEGINIGIYHDFMTEWVTGLNSLHRITELSTQRGGRIIDAIERANIRGRLIAARATASAAYLRFNELLPDVPDADFLEFYKLCLDINADTYNGIINDEVPFGASTRQEADQKFVAAHKANVDKHLKNRGMVDPPEWFGKIKDTSWQNYTTFMSMFGLMLADKNGIKISAKNNRQPVFVSKPGEQWLVAVSMDELPEWFDADMTQRPNTEEVEEEFLEDSEEYEINKELINAYSGQVKRIHELCKIKTGKTLAHFERRRRSLERRSQSLISLLLYLQTTFKNDEYTYPVEGYDEGDHRKLEATKISTEKSQNRVIADFVRGHGIDEVGVALWIESEFGEAKVAFDKDSLTRIADFFRSNPTEEDYYRFKDENKDLHKLVRYTFKPLFESLDEDEKDYLFEVALSSHPYEFMYELGQFLGIMKQEPEKLAGLKILLDRYRKFLTKWLTSHNNETFMYSLYNASQNIGRKVLDVEDGQASEHEEILMDRSVYESSEEEAIRLSTLSGWTVNLVSDYNSYKTEQITGEDLEEYEASLDSVFVKTGVGFSIKTGSIVRALDYFLTVPPDVLASWPTEKVNGVVYYKIKRGGVRIFCKPDRESRTMLFFPYQKKSMEYRFRAG